MKICMGSICQMGFEVDWVVCMIAFVCRLEGSSLSPSEQPGLFDGDALAGTFAGLLSATSPWPHGHRGAGPWLRAHSLGRRCAGAQACTDQGGGGATEGCFIYVIAVHMPTAHVVNNVLVFWWLLHLCSMCACVCTGFCHHALYLCCVCTKQDSL